MQKKKKKILIKTRPDPDQNMLQGSKTITALRGEFLNSICHYAFVF